MSQIIESVLRRADSVATTFAIPCGTNADGKEVFLRFTLRQAATRDKLPELLRGKLRESSFRISIPRVEHADGWVTTVKPIMLGHGLADALADAGYEGFAKPEPAPVKAKPEKAQPVK